MINMNICVTYYEFWNLFSILSFVNLEKMEQPPKAIYCPFYWNHKFIRVVPKKVKPLKIEINNLCIVDGLDWYD